jgi:hypothetical protein
MPESVTITVTVNGVPWTRLPSVAKSESDQAVFAINAGTGAVVFGDGVAGKAPPVGSNIIVTYRYGIGSTGSIAKRIEQKSDRTKFWVSASPFRRAIGWG